MIKRKLYKQLQDHLTHKEITLLIGPRQAGKTTLLKSLQRDLIQANKKTLFLNLDIDSDAQYFSSQSKLIAKINLEFGDKPGYVFIDEIQRKMNAGLFLKGVYDRELPYKFIVSGSGSVELKGEIHESLAGRKRLFILNTVSFEEFIDYAHDYQYTDRLRSLFSLNELESQNWLQEYLLYGGYPRVITEPQGQEKRLILNEIYQSYLAQDIAFLLGVKKTNEFTDLVKFLAAEIGLLFTHVKASSLLNISFPTLQNYLWALENTFIVKKISPYSTNLLKELKKAPVYYFYDLGMRNMALDSFALYQNQNERGFLFQNFIFRLLTDCLSDSSAQLHYWRTKQQDEVDFVIETGQQLLPVEVKYRDLSKNSIHTSLRNFLREYKPKNALVLNKSYFAQVKEDQTLVTFAPYYYALDKEWLSSFL